MFLLIANSDAWLFAIQLIDLFIWERKTKKQNTRTHTLICRTFERKHTKTLKRQRGKYMIPQSSNCLSFRIFTSNTMWFDWCRSLHVLWMGFLLLFFLSESYSNRLQHMPNAYVYKSIQFQFYRLVACARYCTIFTYTYLYLTVKQSRIEYNFVFSCDTVSSLTLS